MTDHGEPRFLPAWLRRVPDDLLVVVVLVAAVSGVEMLLPSGLMILRIVLGLPLLLFLPGYAAVAVLFPQAPARGSGNVSEDQERDGIDTTERLLYSVVTSVVVVALIGVVIDFSPLPLSALAIVVGVSSVTLAFTAVAVHRRWALPPDRRLSVPVSRWLAGTRAWVTSSRPRSERLAVTLMVATALLTVGLLGYTVSTPGPTDAFTEFYLLTEDDNGELIADDYPRTFDHNETRYLYVGIENNERRMVEYTVVVLLQDVDAEAGTVVRQQRIDEFRVSLTAGQTWHHRHAVTPQQAGEGQRLTYLLYRGAPPARPTAANVDQELHLWVDVRPPERTESGESRPVGQ